MNTTKSSPIEHVQKVMECFCDLYTEGITISELVIKTKLKPKDVINVLKEYKGLFTSKEFNLITKICFLYLYRAKSLKCAYTIFKNSNISSINFGWNKEDTEFMNEMSNPKYINRTFKSLKKALNWDTDKLSNVISKWQDKGVVCKKGKKVAFTYLGWPLWASIMIARIWLPNKDQKLQSTNNFQKR